MYKKVGTAAEFPHPDGVVDFYSLGSCGAGMSLHFTDYINHWKHNGYWLFDSPAVMAEIAETESINLSEMTLFYYEYYEYEFDREDESGVMSQVLVKPDESFGTYVQIPESKILVGFDVVEFSQRNCPECSLLSCTDVGDMFAVNQHCLFDTFEEAKSAVESGKFHDCELGPYRIVAVYTTST